MKLSLKLNNDETKKNPENSKSFLFKAKCPINLLNYPFISSLSLSTNSINSPKISLKTLIPSFPSLSVSYTPNSNSPFSFNILSLSTHFSLSADFNISGFNSNFGENSRPSFCLLVKPRFGDFSLKKCVFSKSCGDFENNDSLGTNLVNNEVGFVPINEFENKKSDLMNNGSVFKFGDSFSPMKVDSTKSDVETGFYSRIYGAKSVNNGDFSNKNAAFPKSEDQTGKPVFLRSNTDPGGKTENSQMGDFSSKKPFSLKSDVIKRPEIWDEIDMIREKNLKMDQIGEKGLILDQIGGKDKFLDQTREKGMISGVSVLARTAIPVTKRVSLKFRWGVNFSKNFLNDFRKNLPFLSVDKISIERVEEVKKEENKSLVEFELLKGMCVSFGRELEGLRKENREMKKVLDEMKIEEIRKKDSKDFGYKNGAKNDTSDGVMKRVVKVVPMSENLGNIEGWNKVKKKGVVKEPKSSSLSEASDLESELQKAIKAASSA